ncbi:uncharacterized protein [Chelonus insularis]|uniref:uncharacterized protein n=1 Tax=Chelonus insularis TaxID=460826 RepID=UPI00158BF67D|nr:uncharacterized protein LOC118069707 [Chelonus insularis]
MTKDELRKIFQTTLNEVPQYEVASISHTLHKRSVDESQIVRIHTRNESVRLYLNPTEGFLIGENTPVWTVMPDRSASEGLKYQQIENAFDNIGKAYQDVDSDSALVIQKSPNGDVKLYGRFRSDFVIKPIPTRILTAYPRSSKLVNETGDDFEQNYSHIIYKRPEYDDDQIKNGIKLVERYHKNRFGYGRMKRSLPDIIYPELLVILDYSLYNVLGKDYEAAVRYLVSFWNAVDLRYRTMTEPQIRLNLAGFIISIREGGTPYLEEHRRGVNELDADGALQNMSQYFFRESRFPFEVYDMAVALTNLDMCNIEYGYCDTSTLGYAYEAGACNRSSIDLNTEAVGIIEDNGGYSAVLPATHEVAHLLGVPHDGTEDTFTCSGYEGFIMTGTVTFGRNSFFWSDCSKKAFLDFFNSEDAACLFNKPKESPPLPRLLPGQIATLDEQCSKVFGTRACYHDYRVCIRLDCYIPRGNGTCNGISAAAEGSDCGNGMHCIRGNCILKNATMIPETKKKFTILTRRKVNSLLLMFSDCLCEQYKLLYVFILFYGQLLELITDNEIQSIFQTNRNSVPEYEVVPVLHSMTIKNPRNPEVHFKAFGHDISLYLWPTEGMLFGEHTPIYTVESNRSAFKGLHYTKYNQYGLYYAFRDEENNAAIIVRQDKQKRYKFDGTFNKKYVIRSLPERIVEKIIKRNKSYFKSNLFPKAVLNNPLYTLTNHHVIFKMSEKHNKLKNPKDIIFSATDELLSNQDISMIMNKLHEAKGNQNTVYPEILVIVDYDTFKSFGSDISETLVYLSAFWNGVDLRYRILNNPKIHLNLAIIIIALDNEATPYLNKYKVSDIAISSDAMSDVGKYFYEETRFSKSSYDIAVVMTRLKICEWPVMRNNESECAALRGISKFGSACAWNEEGKKLEAIALVHDEGFNGIPTAAHELGHILGVPHDGSPSASYIGGPGATKCRWEDGYLMSSNRFTENAFKWSSCSIECFKYFLGKPASKCLYNRPKLNIELPKILPGTLMSLDEQCYNAGALDACYHDERACTLLYCTDRNNTNECYATSPAAEGSTCGNEKICIQGECVKKRHWKTVNPANF